MTIAPPPSIDRAREHTPVLVLSEHARESVHGSGAPGRLNTRLALWITNSVGSMWCAYAFTALALVSLPAALASESPIVIVSWIAQTFLQLVLLPIIIVGQNVQSAASDARARADHDTLNAVHTLAVDVLRITEQQLVILDALEERAART